MTESDGARRETYCLFAIVLILITTVVAVSLTFPLSTTQSAKRRQAKIRLCIYGRIANL